MRQAEAEQSRGKEVGVTRGVGGRIQFMEVDSSPAATNVALSDLFCGTSVQLWIHNYYDPSQRAPTGKVPDQGDLCECPSSLCLTSRPFLQVNLQ